MQQTSVDRVVGTVQTAMQLLSYAGAALIIGTSVFLFRLWPAGRVSRRMRRLMTVGFWSRWSVRWGRC